MPLRSISTYICIYMNIFCYDYVRFQAGELVYSGMFNCSSSEVLNTSGISSEFWGDITHGESFVICPMSNSRSVHWMRFVIHINVLDCRGNELRAEIDCWRNADRHDWVSVSTKAYFVGEPGWPFSYANSVYTFMCPADLHKTVRVEMALLKIIFVNSDNG